MTAVIEGAIAAVFEHIKNEITFEIDTPESQSNWRELVAAARKEMEAEDIPDPTCGDLEEWETEVEGLAEAILWDRDYDDSRLYIDFSPEKSEQLRDWAGIPEDYFMAIADDLTDEQAQVKIKELKALCQSVMNLS